MEAEVDEVEAVEDDDDDDDDEAEMEEEVRSMETTVAGSEPSAAATAMEP